MNRTIKIAALEVGTVVAIHNHRTAGTIAKRAGKNLYWVTMSTGTHGAFSVLKYRNTFSVYQPR